MILAAREIGKIVIVANSDDWLMRKKGYIFMPFRERREILEGFRWVYDTTFVDDTDDTVCEALRRLKPDYFANGGDRKTNNTPEMDVCKELGIQMLWSIGGSKIQSSSDLVGASGMLIPSPVEVDGVELKPSRVEIVAGGDISKNGDY